MLPRILLYQTQRRLSSGFRAGSLSKYYNVATKHKNEMLQDPKHQSDRKNSHNNDNTDNGYFKFAKPLGASAFLGSVFISYRNYSSYDEPPSGNNPPPIVEDLQQAVLAGDERRVSVLLKQCTPNDVNARHKLGWQPLHVAAANGQSRICELLLQGGARVNDPDQYSPRQLSEKLNIDPLVVALIRDNEFNPDLARVNFYGSTALHYAALSNSLETVEVLAKHGANPTIRNAMGYQPSKFGNHKVAEYLAKYEQEYVKREKELEEEERRRYPLELRIKDRIVGQEAAISMVAATIRRKENGWFDDDHPLVFLFLGSSGIGKTELAKQVAKYLHKDDKKAFIRLDMSEYQEKHSVARMIGSPPGYVGYQDGGQLTDALKKCNNAVVLFDEVEKAHPEVLTILLQLFDEGRLTDGKGQTIECKDAIFIMTSNLASEAIAEHAMQLRAEQQLARKVEIENRLKSIVNSDSASQHQEQITISRKFKDEIVRPILKAHLLRDEFLGRINEMVYFLPFSDSELRQLVVKELEFWATKAKNNNSIEMTWDDKVIDVICRGYDIHYGARSIKHEVERRIINQISELHHAVKKAKKVHVNINDKNSDGADLINIKIS